MMVPRFEGFSFDSDATESFIFGAALKRIKAKVVE
jgi:hypothetical protein